jgi:putative solute:sodium symporter small subunit
MESTPEQRRAAYWLLVTRLTRALLLIWFMVTFVVIFFAQELSQVTIFGWPLSFYMAAQGIVLVYLALVGFYVWSMRRYDNSLMNGSSHDQR